MVGSRFVLSKLPVAGGVSGIVYAVRGQNGRECNSEQPKVAKKKKGRRHY